LAPPPPPWTPPSSRRDDDERSHLGEVYPGQAWVPVDEELAHRRRGE